MSNCNSAAFLRSDIDQSSIAVAAGLCLGTWILFAWISLKIKLWCSLCCLLKLQAAAQGMALLGFPLALATEPVNLATSFFCTPLASQIFSVIHTGLGQPPATSHPADSTGIPGLKVPLECYWIKKSNINTKCSFKQRNRDRIIPLNYQKAA